MSLNVSGLIRVPSTVNQACTARKPASRASELPIVRVWRDPVAGERGEPVGTVCRDRDSVGALSTTGSLLPSGDSGTQHRRTRPVSYTHLRAHETRHDLVCRLLLEKKK